MDERNNGPSQILVQGRSGAIDTPAETLRVCRLDRHPHSGSSHSPLQTVMCSVRSTCGLRIFETITRLGGHVLSTSAWKLESQCCLRLDNEGAECGSTCLLYNRLIVPLPWSTHLGRNITTKCGRGSDALPAPRGTIAADHYWTKISRGTARWMPIPVFSTPDSHQS